MTNKVSYVPAIRRNGWTAWRGQPEATIDEAIAVADTQASNYAKTNTWVVTVFTSDNIVAATRLNNKREWEIHRQMTEEEFAAFVDVVEATVGKKLI